MLYPDGPVGGWGFCLIGISAASLLTGAGMAYASKDDLTAMARNIWFEMVVFCAAAPLAAILVAATTQRLSTAGAWVVFAIVLSWLATFQSLLVSALHRRTNASANDLGRSQAAEALQGLPAGSEHSPRVEVHTEAIRGVNSIANLTNASPAEILAGTQASLVGSYMMDDHDDIPVAGWPQFLDSQKMPSAIGSAYGLRLMQRLNFLDSEIDLRHVVDSIIAMQRPNGGWSARSQRGDRGHPEVTAWVLPPLLRTGVDRGVRLALLDSFDSLIRDSEGDDVSMSHVSVLSTVLSALTQIHPSSANIRPIQQRLIAGVRRVEADGVQMAAWPATTDHEANDLSTPHTARALLALLESEAVRPTNGAIIELREPIIRWLTERADLTLFDEPIRRYVTEGTDEIVIGHFTPIWVARVHMRASSTPDMASLRTAMLATLARQRAGVWLWTRSSDKPIWMAYQGASVVQEYVLRNLPWPV